MSYPGVRCAKVVPRVNGVNTVGILLHGAGVNEALIAQMQEEIGQLKEINVDLSIEKAKEKPQQIEVEIAVEDGYSFEDISALCQQAVGRMMERQKIGQGLFPALVCREIFTCEGVENCRVKLPAQDLIRCRGKSLPCPTVQSAAWQDSRRGGPGGLQKKNLRADAFASALSAGSRDDGSSGAGKLSVGAGAFLTAGKQSLCGCADFLLQPAAAGAV